MPDVYALLQRAYSCFLKAQEITEKDKNPNLLPTRFLMARPHSAWLAAVRTALSAQTVEAYPLLRAVIIEDAWHALHLAKNPAPPARADVWLRRGESDNPKRLCKAEFTVAKARATHRALDAATEQPSSRRALPLHGDAAYELGAVRHLGQCSARRPQKVPPGRSAYGVQEPPRSTPGRCPSVVFLTLRTQYRGFSSLVSSEQLRAFSDSQRHRYRCFTTYHVARCPAPTSVGETTKAAR